MDFGIAYFPTDESIPPAEMARMCEQRGFESVFVTDHTHVPVKRETPHPAFGEIPREYMRIHDPFVALGTMAAATDQIKIGTAICLVVERDPIDTAKAVASVDQLSGGRMLFGVGAGWLLEEMRNHGTDPERRFGILKERVEAMKAIWTEDEAEYHGRYVDFDPIWAWPKPLQKPHPPVIVGGNGRTVYDRVIGYGDGWMPNRIGDDDKIIARIEKLQRLGKEAGRDSVPVSLQLPPRKDHELLKRYEDAGVTRSIFMLPSSDRDEVERKLDQYTEAMNGYNASGG